MLEGRRTQGETEEEEQKMEKELRDHAEGKIEGMEKGS